MVSVSLLLYSQKRFIGLQYSKPSHATAVLSVAVFFACVIQARAVLGVGSRRGRPHSKTGSLLPQMQCQMVALCNGLWLCSSIVFVSITTTVGDFIVDLRDRI